jgi:hypothetical protein
VIWTGDKQETAYNILLSGMILLWRQQDFAPGKFVSMVLLEDLVPPLQLHLGALNR